MKQLTIILFSILFFHSYLTAYDIELVIDGRKDGETNRHNIAKTIKTCICKKVFKNYEDSIEHINQDHFEGIEGRIYYCNKCGFKFVKTDTFLLHMPEHTVDVFKCKICNFNTKKVHSLENHIYSHIKYASVCEHLTQQNLSLEINNGHVICPYCPSQFVSSNNCLRHIETQHSYYLIPQTNTTGVKRKFDNNPSKTSKEIPEHPSESRKRLQIDKPIPVAQEETTPDSFSDSVADQNSIKEIIEILENSETQSYPEKGEHTDEQELDLNNSQSQQINSDLFTDASDEYFSFLDMLNDEDQSYINPDDL